MTPSPPILPSLTLDDNPAILQVGIPRIRGNMHAYGCSVGAKFQITLPKAVRAALHIEKKGEMVGFMVQGERVILAKARIEPEETFTQEEWDKLLRLAQEQPEKSFKSGKEFLQDFRKFAHSRKHL